MGLKLCITAMIARLPKETRWSLSLFLCLYTGIGFLYFQRENRELDMLNDKGE